MRFGQVVEIFDRQGSSPLRYEVGLKSGVKIYGVLAIGVNITDIVMVDKKFVDVREIEYLEVIGRA